MERAISGLGAAAGVAVGAAWPIHPLSAVARTAGSPGNERTALTDAIQAAAAAINALAAAQAGEAAEMLGFQVAMLEDEALAEGAFAAIAAGMPAHQAWAAALDAEIAGYLAADDPHFRARSSDLADIRDRVLRHLFGLGAVAIRSGDVIVAEDLQPSQFLAVDWSKGGGVALGAGSPTSHVATLARARSVPMVVGLGPSWTTLSGIVAVDGDAGRVIIAPSAATLAETEQRSAARKTATRQAEHRRLEPAVTRDGTRIAVSINVSGVEDIAGFAAESCDGIGLARTEFLAGDALDDEERQFGLYRALVRWADGRPVTIRTLDAGGDKPIPGYTVEDESNPFLGLRGIRLSLRHPDRFGVQLRALARAAADGPVRIMLPMVTRQDEIDAAGRLLDQATAELQAAGLAHARPPLGIMVEVPALAFAIGDIRADFLSIGSNDLTQYAAAAARDNPAVSAYADTLHPGVLGLIAHVARHGSAGGRSVSLCGDAGADPRSIPALLRAGLRSLSVPPGLVAATKEAIRAVDLSEERGHEP
ncbi:phosphotransferase system, enzyme I, PtsI [Bosea sp. CRIB-10]|uniref:phosphoenolpyruvate--protein phosphotransferase n=1 Tax=Bosea sp. CRIB-10 TaxID=378404 RepID=UPI0008E024F1|nr:putative PEP-binding protein [Bosea sp. CRIB-10]SFB78078.1 phosphotransferase system, enzyme I, PtsI [Bosea sp. CRIB-10]